jgi:hypothetical protein
MQNKVKNTIVLIFLVFVITSSYSVKISKAVPDDITIYHSSDVCQGYTLISKMTDETILIDMDGNVIHTWSLQGYQSRMLPGGNLLGGNTRNLLHEFISVAQEDWNGTIVWEFHNWENGSARAHHDLQREGNPVGYYAPGQYFLPEGSTLILARNTTTKPEMSRKQITDDVIYEVSWNGTLTGFEWHASDHIDEMGLSTIAKIGIYINPGGPGLILGSLPGDWLHINSISFLGENKWYDAGDERFHPQNIMICSRHANFIAIISKKTGEILWRYGPDFLSTTECGKKPGRIIGPHQAHLIPKGLPGEGNILVFDNGGFSGYGLFGFPNLIRFYSRVIEFNPITYDIIQEYSHKEGLYPFPRTGDCHRFFSFTLSSAQRLPNGNTLICEGNGLRVFEVTPENTIVWEYMSTWQFVEGNFYRAYRVPPEWVPGNPAGYEPWE